jgi:predicted AlkP superfamily pyrophosphatase or phosphodiesterase
MWTAWNDCIQRPQIWDILREHDNSLTSAVWFPLHSKGCGAEYVCTPAPVHNPDGSESLWCYTKPMELYGTLRDALGHFPLQHFWGPLANIRSTAWIVDSAVHAAQAFRPRFQYIYLPHLDYAAQKHGPDSQQATIALAELDEALGKLIAGERAAFGAEEPLWLIAGEYPIVPVNHVSYPNRALRDAGLLEIHTLADGEHLDVQTSAAWALVDHQFSHVFVRDRDQATIDRVVDLFRGQDGFDEVLTAAELSKYDLAHDRSGDVVLVSRADSWQAYYWWLDEARAPAFARTVDIHRKPGYDPVELFFDPTARGIPLDATLVRGSHGAPPHDARQRTVLLSSQRGVHPSQTLADVDVCDLVLRQFGV